jgi:hypothetical protein
VFVFLDVKHLNINRTKEFLQIKTSDQIFILNQERIKKLFDITDLKWKHQTTQLKIFHPNLFS